MVKKSAILFLGYFGIMIVGSSLLMQFTDIVYASFIVSMILLVLALFLFKDHLMAEWHRFRADTPSLLRFSGKLFGYYLLMLLLRIAGIWLLDLFMDTSTLGQNQEILNDAAENMNVLANVLLLTIYAPIVEELVFRQAIIGPWAKDKRVMIIVSTIFSMFLFTYMHSFQWADFVLYLPITVVLTQIYWEYDRNIVPSILFHFLNNAIALAMMYVLFAVESQLPV
ncbi:lysostaphin resistance A-like protein [Fundicoccus sp. Sow4_F4]|uniref:CPBP family intramembrane glutamic endopeptidase n=1 Tax=Fundicoccus sp. Sow4_F4 TaxID=3438783 RepID=UPI003F9121B5